MVIYLDCCYAGKMPLRLQNNRKIPENLAVLIQCSSGPNDLSLDVEKYGGTLISRTWLS